MPEPRWTLRIFPLDANGNPLRQLLRTRKCNTGDLAKTWGRKWAQDILRDGVAGVRCNILDPAGDPWARADVTAIKPGRLEWTWLAISGQ